MRKTSLAVLFVGCVVPLLAHHSVAAEFDKSKTITIQGTVNRVEWMNPHARLWVDAMNQDGTVSHWELELAPPNTLNRMLQQPGEPKSAGKDFFKTGDQVGVTLWRAKDGSLVGHAITVTMPDGRVSSLPGGWP